MNENVRKFVLYLQPTFTYWQLRATSDYLKPDKFQIGYYPLSFKRRLSQSHYQFFDDDGLPLSFVMNGDLAHHVTTISSFCFAHWELYLETGDNRHSEPIIKAANYFLSKAKYHEPDRATVLWYYDQSEISGKNCAMDQGEAISVLLRAYCLTNDSSYLELADHISSSFLYPLRENGVAMPIPGSDDIWYLESESYILNGHIYSIIGLWELWRVSGQSKHQKLFEAGYESVISQIHQFDIDYWSIYDIAKPNYIASMMYHNLHICQLLILNEIRPNKTLTQYAAKFEAYAKNPMNRLRAAFALLSSKITQRISPNAE